MQKMETTNMSSTEILKNWIVDGDCIHRAVENPHMNHRGAPSTVSQFMIYVTEANKSLDLISDEEMELVTRTVQNAGEMRIILSEIASNGGQVSPQMLERIREIV